jgi:hypothetical protein
MSAVKILNSIRICREEGTACRGSGTFCGFVDLLVARLMMVLTAAFARSTSRQGLTGVIGGIA